MRMTHRSGAPPGFVMAILAAFVLMVGAPTLAEAKPNTPSLQLSAVQADMEHAVVGTNTICAMPTLQYQVTAAPKAMVNFVVNDQARQQEAAAQVCDNNNRTVYSNKGQNTQNTHWQWEQPHADSVAIGAHTNKAWWRDWSQKRHEVSFG